MKAITYVLLATVLLVSLVLGCAKPAPGEPIVLKMITFQPKASLASRPPIKFAELVNQYSNGELIIDYVGGPEVIPMFEQPKAVKEGLIDIVQTPTAFYKGMFPEGLAHHLSPYHVSEERNTEYHEWLVEVHKEKMNVYYLGRAATQRGFQVWTTKKPISKPQELAGLKVLSSGLHLPFSKALGMAPVSLPFPEHYGALERGVVDAGMEKISVVATFDLYEQVKYVVDHEFYGDNCALIVNLDKWNKLPKHLKDIMIKAQIEMDKKWLWAITDQNHEEGWKEINEKAKVEHTKFSPEDEKWFYDLAEKASWDEVKRSVSPELYAKLRDLLAK